MPAPVVRSVDPSAPNGQARVVVSVGTDHHRFDRLIRWVDDYLSSRDNVEFVVQRGTSQEARRVDSEELIPHSELLDLFSSATAVVCHGGPATVMDARRSGRRPIVVPRDPERDEHVDGHQLRFARHLEAEGIAIVVTDEAAFFAALDGAIADPASVVHAETVPDVPAGVVKFGATVDALLGVTTPISEPT